MPQRNLGAVELLKECIDGARVEGSEQFVSVVLFHAGVFSVELLHEFVLARVRLGYST